MSCRIDDNWTYRGLKAIIVENRHLRATLLPESGAKLWELVHKPSDREFLWHNPRVELRAPVFRQDADGWWFGGLDECIPTGHPCNYKGDLYPMLGETWSLPWDYETLQRGHSEVEVHLWRTTPIAPLLVERWVSLRHDESILRFRHKVTNLGLEPFEMLWGMHPAWTIDAGYRVDLPSCNVEVAESLPGDRLGEPGTVFAWPYATDQAGGVQLDLRQVRGVEAGTADFMFASGFDEGWFSITDPRAQVGVGMVFPAEVFRSIWVYLVYGGCRGWHVAAVEPWTGHPEKLVDAVERGLHRTIGPGEAIDAETKVVAYTGCRAVARIDIDGNVTSC